MAKSTEKTSSSSSSSSSGAVFSKDVSCRDDQGCSSAKLRPRRSRYLGLTLAVLYGLFQVVVQIIVKYLYRFNASEMNLYQTIIETIIVLPFIVFDGTKFVFFRFAFLLVIRSVFASLRFYFRIFATKSLPIAEANALYFTSPVFMAIGSKIFLKYSFNNAIYASFFSNAMGFLMVSRLWALNVGDSQRALGLASILVAVLVNAMADIVLKKLTINDLSSKLVVLYISGLRSFYMLVVVELENGFQVPRLPSCDYGNPLISEPVLLLLMGAFTLLVQITSVEAIKLEHPSTVSAVSTSVMLPSFLISQIVVFGDIPSVLTIVGTFAILCGSLVINFAQIIEKMEDGSKMKKIFRILNE